MKFNKIVITLISLLLLLLAACNNDDTASQHDEGNYTSSAKTGKSSNEYPHTEEIKNNDNDNPNFFGLNVEKRDWNRQEWYRQGGDRLKQNQQEPNRQNQEAEKNNTNQNKTQTTQGLSEYASAVIKLTNEERRKNGLSELKADKELSNVARKKSMDMQSEGYFSHTSPTYGSPFDMMRDFGVSYKSAGENIAKGQQTPEQVVEAWMNSEGHRENILNGSFTHIGVGFTQDGHLWTQMFIRK